MAALLPSYTHFTARRFFLDAYEQNEFPSLHASLITTIKHDRRIVYRIFTTTFTGLFKQVVSLIF